MSRVSLTLRVRGGESPVIPAGPEGVTFLGTGHQGDWLLFSSTVPYITANATYFENKLISLQLS